MHPSAARNFRRRRRFGRPLSRLASKPTRQEPRPLRSLKLAYLSQFSHLIIYFALCCAPAELQLEAAAAAQCGAPEQSGASRAPGAERRWPGGRPAGAMATGGPARCKHNGRHCAGATDPRPRECKCIGRSGGFPLLFNLHSPVRGSPLCVCTWPPLVGRPASGAARPSSPAALLGGRSASVKAS